MNKYYKIQYVIELKDPEPSFTIPPGNRTYLVVTASLIQFLQALIDKFENTQYHARIIDVSEIDEELFNILNVCPILN